MPHSPLLRSERRLDRSSPRRIGTGRRQFRSRSLQAPGGSERTGLTLADRADAGLQRPGRSAVSYRPATSLGAKPQAPPKLRPTNLRGVQSDYQLAADEIQGGPPLAIKTLGVAAKRRALPRGGLFQPPVSEGGQAHPESVGERSGLGRRPPTGGTRPLAESVGGELSGFRTAFAGEGLRPGADRLDPQSYGAVIRNFETWLQGADMPGVARSEFERILGLGGAQEQTSSQLVGAIDRMGQALGLEAEGFAGFSELPISGQEKLFGFLDDPNVPDQVAEGAVWDAIEANQANLEFKEAGEKATAEKEGIIAEFEGLASEGIGSGRETIQGMRNDILASVTNPDYVAYKQELQRRSGEDYQVVTDEQVTNAITRGSENVMRLVAQHGAAAGAQLGGRGIGQGGLSQQLAFQAQMRGAQAQDRIATQATDFQTEQNIAAQSRAFNQLGDVLGREQALVLSGQLMTGELDLGLDRLELDWGARIAEAKAGGVDAELALAGANVPFDLSYISAMREAFKWLEEDRLFSEEEFDPSNETLFQEFVGSVFESIAYDVAPGIGAGFFGLFG